jgi:hypothetical protein
MPTVVTLYKRIWQRSRSMISVRVQWSRDFEAEGERRWRNACTVYHIKRNKTWFDLTVKYHKGKRKRERAGPKSGGSIKFPNMHKPVPTIPRLGTSDREHSL